MPAKLPALQDASISGNWSVLDIILSTIQSCDSFGNLDHSNAIAPAAIGEANEVPETTP